MYNTQKENYSKSYIFAKITRIKALTKVPETLREGGWVRGYITQQPVIGSIVSMAQEEKNGNKNVDIFNTGVVKSLVKEDNQLIITTENSEYLIKILEN